jgi:hypothetical protein
MPNQAAQPQATTSKAVTLTHDQIAKRAYEKWIKKGRPHGTNVQDWLEAEAELRREIGGNARR